MATNTARPAISLPAGSGDAYNLVITPDGKRLYVLTPRNLVPIRQQVRAGRQSS